MTQVKLAYSTVVIAILTRKQSTELLISSLFYCISFRKSAFHSAGYLENKFLSKCGWVCIIGPRLIGSQSHWSPVRTNPNLNLTSL